MSTHPCLRSAFSEGRSSDDVDGLQLKHRQAWLISHCISERSLVCQLDKGAHPIGVVVGPLLQQICDSFGAVQDNEVLCQ